MKKWFTPKLLKIMRLCMLQSVLVMVTCGVCLAHDNYGQILERKVSLRLHEVPLEKALNEITTITNVRFAYSKQSLDVAQNISIDVVDTPLRELLPALLAPLEVSFIVHENEASIVLKSIKDDRHRRHSDEQITITGTVTTTEGSAIPGVNIIVKGTTAGTTTDADGQYTLSADDNSILVFSFIGYLSVEAQVGGRTVIDAVLQEDVKKLGEVIVNGGYWTVADHERTGNIGRITSKEISSQPVSNAVAALQGRIPGLEVTQSTGVPGGNFKVRIRGTNSIDNGNDPLYIIDGVPFLANSLAMPETSRDVLGSSSNALASGGTSPLNSINPNDIESIEVLKDAAATAIYGSRGSNGVILITTKKGKSGNTKAEMSVYYGLARVSHFADLLDTRQYLQMRKEAFTNDNVVPTVSNARDLLVWDTTRYTDWQKELIGGTAAATDAQVNLSGGDHNTQFTFGGGYHKETTVFPGDNSDKRYSTHLSINNNAFSGKIRTMATITYSMNQTDFLRRDLTSMALSLPPNAPAMRDESGEVAWTNWNNSLENPLASVKRKFESTNTSFIINVVPTYSVTKNLDIKFNLGYTNIANEAILQTPKSSLDPAIVPFSQNQTNFSNSAFQNWIAEPQVNWRPRIGLNSFNVLAGATFLEQTRRGLGQTALGFSSEALMRDLASAPTRITGTNYFSQYRYAAIFGRLNYILKDRYIIDLTARRDGSSRFGPGNQFANFGAIGAAWLFSEESFVKRALPFLSLGKLRTSYGVTGNDQLTDYTYLDSYRSGSVAYQGTIGLNPSRLSNPYFSWETNKKFESALELSAFQARLSASFSYYVNRSSNQLVGYPLAPTTGFATIQGNLPAVVENRGLEIELSAKPFVSSGWSWTIGLNATIPKNELLEFPGLENSPSYANTYVVGQPLRIVKGFQYAGVDPLSGLYTFTDTNSDGILDTKDRTSATFIGQRFFGGLVNSLTYRGFQLDFLFQFVSQTGLDYQYYTTLPGAMANQPSAVLDRWTKQGDFSDVERFGTNNTAFGPYSNLSFSDRIVTDASFVRLKNVSLSYSFPQHLSAKWHSSGTRLFLLAQNLLTVTNYIGLDPENYTNTLPPLRVVTLGVNVSF